MAALQRHRNRTLFRGRLTEFVHIDLGATDGTDETALEAVLPLLTATLESDGWSSELEQIIYDVNDEGTSCWFELTTAQRAGAESRLAHMGVPTDVLVPFPDASDHGPPARCKPPDPVPDGDPMWDG